MHFYVALSVFTGSANVCIFTWYLEALVFSHMYAFLHGIWTHLYGILMIIWHNLWYFVIFGGLAGWIVCPGWAGWVGWASALAASWEPPGSLLGAFWESSGSLLGVLGASWEPLGRAFLHCIYHGILSLGTILHAHLLWYPFPGDDFACVFTVVSFPRGLICMRIYRGILSLGTNLHAYLPWYPFSGD